MCLYLDAPNATNPTSFALPSVHLGLSSWPSLFCGILIGDGEYHGLLPCSTPSTHFPVYGGVSYLLFIMTREQRKPAAG